MSKDRIRLNKRALLIGINSYPFLPAISQLKGCVNDVTIMKNTLQASFGFPKSNIAVLTDEMATQGSIRDAMLKLVADTVEGDIVVFHYSGHGSRMASEKGDKASGYDETIMPSDSGRMSFDIKAENRDIRDNEIQEWLARLSSKTRHITLIFDSCHSGSITRWITAEMADGNGTKLRWIPPDPSPEDAMVLLPSFKEGISSRDANGSGWLLRSDRYVLLAACAANQGAFEMECRDAEKVTRYGAFTYSLVQEINKAGRIKTYRDIWSRSPSR